MTNLIAPTRAEIEEAKRRLGLASPKQGLDTGARPAAEVVEEGEQSFGGRVADGFRSVVPQSVRDLGSPIKRAFGFIDKPISQRLGFEGFEERAGPLDEIGTFAVEELTRPTNYLAALAGGPAATGLARAGRVGKAVGGFIAPVSRGNAAQRIVAEGVVSAAARGAGEAANEYLPEDTPTPVRIAVGLGAGVVGGVAGARAATGVSRGTIGRDILAIAPQPVRAKAQTPDPFPRKGALLNARTEDHLANATVKDVLAEARDLEATAGFQQNRLNAGARNALNRIGQATKQQDGNFYVKDANGAPQLLQDVLENPTRYTLTPDQQAAVSDFATLFKTIHDERVTFGVEPKDADLDAGQNFISRKAVEDTKGAALDNRRGTGRTLSGGGRDRSRTFDDPLDAVKNDVVYAHPLEAFDLYTARGLKKAADTHVQSLLVPFSESSAVRVPAGLRAQHDGLAQMLQSSKATLGRLSDRYRTTVDAYLNSAEPNMDELLVELDDVVVRGGGRNAGRDVPAMQAEVDRIKAEIKALRPAWKEALEQAKSVPAGRATVNIGAAPLLAGRDFDANDAKVIEAFYTRGIGNQTQIGKLAAGSRWVNSFAVPIQAIGDMSSMLNQMGWMAFSHPIQFTKNALKSMRDMINPSEYERWVLQNGEDAASHGVAVLGQAGRTTEFEMNSWMERIPVFRQLNRHFQVFTTRNRIDAYNAFVDTAAKAGAPLSDTDKDQIGRALNRLSGISTSRAGDIETIAEFAPNFLRSGIETFAKAAADGTLEGQLARQYIRNMVVMGQMAVFAGAIAANRDPREVLSPLDPKALKRGEIRLNSNFGTIRVAGQDVSMYGRWDSLARLSVMSMDAVTRSISKQNAFELFDAVGYGLYSKGSPLVGLITDEARGATFTGEDPNSPVALARRLLPFSAQGFIEDLANDVDLGTAAAGGAVNFFGGKARELTAFEQMDKAAQTAFERPWDQLTGEEKAGLEAALPKLSERAKREQERRANLGDTKAQARVEYEQIDAERIQNESLAYKAWVSGGMDSRTFNEALSDYAYRSAKEKERVSKFLELDFGEPEGPQAALSAWFQTFRDAEKAPDVVDFEVQEQLEAALSRRIEAGEFGDPALAQRFIDERKKPFHEPEVQKFFDLKDYVSDSGYYDTADSAFARYASAVGRIFGIESAGYGDLLSGITKAERSGDARTLAALKQIRSAVDKQVSTARQVMRLRDPQLDEALIATGKATVPIRQQRGVGVSLS